MQYVTIVDNLNQYDQTGKIIETIPIGTKLNVDKIVKGDIFDLAYLNDQSCVRSRYGCKVTIEKVKKEKKPK